MNISTGRATLISWPNFLWYTDRKGKDGDLHGSKKESSKEEEITDPACEADLYQMISW